MPYAPSVNDNSGQILAQGINQGIAQLAQGLERNMAERKKKEEDRKAKEAVTSAGKALYGEAFDLKDAPKEDWGKIIQLSQAKQEEPLRQLQLENAQLRQKIDLAQLDQMSAAVAQQKRNQAALTGAFNPTADTAAAIQGGAGFENLPTAAATDPMSAVMRAGKGGADAQTLAHLANMADNLAQAQQRTAPRPERMPTAMTVGTQSGVWDGANWKPDAAPKAPAADRSLTAELIRLDTSAAEAEAAGNTALAATLREAMKYKANGGGALSNEGMAKAMADMFGSKTTPAAAPSTAAKPAGKSTSAPTPAPAPKKGTRARQNGIIYEFDGKTWVEVK